ncbi:MAG: hypothetical protein U0263_11115 [Polyangiaceae bacterium]
MPPAPPPDFRHVGIEPGPTRRRVRHIVFGSGLFAFSLGVLAAWRLDWVSVFLALVVAGSAMWIATRAVGPVLAGERLSEARMSIVPWGVLVHDDPEPRVLHWPAVREVQVDCVHEMDHATPSTRWSVVKIRTERETLGGRAPGDVALELLEAHFQRYAEEAGRPVALDLDGDRHLDDRLEPVGERLLADARACRVRGWSSACPWHRRAIERSFAVASPDTRHALSTVLARLDAPADLFGLWRPFLPRSWESERCSNG